MLNTYAPIAIGQTELPAGDQIDRDVIFENLDVRLPRRRVQKRTLNFATGHVFRM
jgi:hypothetical protein